MGGRYRRPPHRRASTESVAPKNRQGRRARSSISKIRSMAVQIYRATESRKGKTMTLPRASPPVFARALIKMAVPGNDAPKTSPPRTGIATNDPCAGGVPRADQGRGRVGMFAGSPIAPESAVDLPTAGWRPDHFGAGSPPPEQGAKGKARQRAQAPKHESQPKEPDQLGVICHVSRGACDRPITQRSCFGLRLWAS